MGMENGEELKRQRRGPNWSLMMPLVYAPMLPLLRITLNGRVAPRTRDNIFMGALLVALSHAGYVMSNDSTMGASGKRH